MHKNLEILSLQTFQLCGITDSIFSIPREYTIYDGINMYVKCKILEQDNFIENYVWQIAAQKHFGRKSIDKLAVIHSQSARVKIVGR